MQHVFPKGDAAGDNEDEDDDNDDDDDDDNRGPKATNDSRK